MNMIKPFMPRQGLKPVLRGIAALDDRAASDNFSGGDNELTFKNDPQAAVGDILLLLIDALNQFRVQNAGAGNISVSGNTTVIKNNICNIVNNYKGVMAAFSPALKALAENISASFSDNLSYVTEIQIDSYIRELNAALAKYPAGRPPRHIAQTGNMSNYNISDNVEIKKLFTDLKKNSDMSISEFFYLNYRVPEDNSALYSYGVRKDIVQNLLSGAVYNFNAANIKRDKIANTVKNGVNIRLYENKNNKNFSNTENRYKTDGYYASVFQFPSDSAALTFITSRRFSEEKVFNGKESFFNKNVNFNIGNNDINSFSQYKPERFFGSGAYKFSEAYSSRRIAYFNAEKNIVRRDGGLNLLYENIFKHSVQKKNTVNYISDFTDFSEYTAANAKLSNFNLDIAEYAGKNTSHKNEKFLSIYYANSPKEISSRENWENINIFSDYKILSTDADFFNNREVYPSFFSRNGVYYADSETYYKSNFVKISEYNVGGNRIFGADISGINDVRQTFNFNESRFALSQNNKDFKNFIGGALYSDLKNGGKYFGKIYTDILNNSIEFRRYSEAEEKALSYTKTSAENNIFKLFRPLDLTLKNIEINKQAAAGDTLILFSRTGLNNNNLFSADFKTKIK